MSGHYEGTLASPETFQGMIQERKMEKKRKAEERRQQDLQRIADMKSTEGINPLERIPKEIWNMIMAEVGCEDRGNMRQVHDIFKDLTESTKVRDILFPRVLKVDQLKQLVEEETDENGMDVPLVKYRPLRCVSKSARNVIDKLQEARILNYMSKMCGRDDYRSEFLILKVSFDPEKEASLNRMLSDFRDENPAKRFFPRCLIIRTFMLKNGTEDIEVFENRVSETLARFAEKIAALLEIIGSQIWHFALCPVDINPARAPALYTYFHDWSSLMPNLKRLEFKSRFSRNQIEGTGALNEMNAVVRDLPFPRLDSLESLVIQVEPPYHVGFLILETVLRTNQHITDVSLDMNWASQSTFPPNAVNTLKSLHLVGFKVSPYYGIEKLLNTSWKLKVISLDLNYGDIPIGSLFKLLERFPTLENVMLDKVRIPCDMKMECLELPNLTEFDIVLRFNRPSNSWPIYISNSSNVHFLLSLQFLLHCKNLKKLSWALSASRLQFQLLRNYMLRHERHETMINFRAGVRVLCYSNIWDIFPQLDRVGVYLWTDTEITEMEDLDEGSCTHKYCRGNISESMSVSSFLTCHECNILGREYCLLRA